MQEYLELASIYQNSSIPELRQEVEFLENKLIKLRTALTKANTCPGFIGTSSIEANYSVIANKLDVARGILYDKLLQQSSCSKTPIQDAFNDAETLALKDMAAAMLDSEQDFVISGR